MSYHLKKRKRRVFDTHGHADHDGETQRWQPDPSLFIQAHEADLVHGPQAASAARSLEVIRGDGKGQPDIVGDGLIEWTGVGRGSIDWSNDEDHMQLRGPSVTSEDAPKGQTGYWVDRYAVC